MPQTAPLAPAEGRFHDVREADVAYAYALFLGRPPENDGAVADKVGMLRTDLVSQFATSSEFEDRVERPVLEGRLPTGPLFDAAPELAVTTWASSFLPLSDSGRAKLAAAATWVGAFAAIFTDRVFVEATPPLQRLHPPARFAAQLEELAEGVGERVLVSAMESASGLSVSGFVLDRAAPDVTMAVELWIDGAFTAAAKADIYRRELQERFNSSGAHGFLFEGFAPPDDASERQVRIEIREAGSKAVLGSRLVDWRPGRDMARIADIASQLDAVRDGLERIERSVQRLTGAFGFTVGAWDTYWRAYYVPTAASQERLRAEAEGFLRRPDFRIALTSDSGDAAALRRTLLSLRDQSWRGFQIVLVDASADPGAAGEVALAKATRLDGADLGGDYVITLDAGDRLAPDALHRYAAAFQVADPTLMYGDSDTLVVSPAGRERHVDPVLRAAFDPDLMLQVPMFGAVAAIASKVLREILRDGASLAREMRADLLLRVIDSRTPPRVIHVPRVIHHRASASESAFDYAAAVSAHLARQGDEAVVASAEDGAGAQVIWPLRPELSAAVIVPTRDRLDLLGPCLASLMAARDANATRLEIVVVDNGSAEAASRRFLQTLGASGGVSLLSFQGAFNWSAINNHAARSTQADVLIFLNNDTVVLDQGFADALCRQAMRSQVGAVGARLLYEDGTIQHAGLILGAGEGVGMHEGVGAQLRDGGYLGRHSLAHRVTAVTGACLATRADVFTALGGFDEDHLAVEANDIDYCLRARRAGLAVLYEPAATLYHFESKSRGHTGLDDERRKRADAELAVLRRRWGDGLRDDPYYNPHFDRGGQPFTRLAPPPQ